EPARRRGAPGFRSESGPKSLQWDQSLTFNHLPARFDDARDVAAQREVPEADPTHVELAQKRARAPTVVAAVAMTNTPLRRLLVGGEVDSLGHVQFLKGMPKCFKSARP